jgi:hypothetical protein
MVFLIANFIRVAQRDPHHALKLDRSSKPA